MITQHHRFHGRGSLRHVYQHGRSVRAPEFGLRFMLQERRRNFRVAVVVSKNISKSAVVRNRIRRRLYEVVRQLSPAIKQPYDLVISVYQPQIENLSPSELAAVVWRLFEQANIIQPSTKDDSKARAIIDTKET